MDPQQVPRPAQRLEHREARDGRPQCVLRAALPQRELGRGSVVRAMELALHRGAVEQLPQPLQLEAGLLELPAPDEQRDPAGEAVPARRRLRLLDIQDPGELRRVVPVPELDGDHDGVVADERAVGARDPVRVGVAHPAGGGLGGPLGIAAEQQARDEVHVAAADVVDVGLGVGDLERPIELDETLIHVALGDEVEAERVPRVALRLPRAHPHRDVDRLLAQLPRLVEPVQEHQQLAVPGQHPRPLRRGPVGRKDRDRRLELGERPRRVGREPQVPPEPLAHDRRPDRVRGGIDLRDHLLLERDVAVGQAGEVGRRRRARDQLGPVAARHRDRVGDVRPQVERPLVLRVRGLERERLLRSLGRGQRRRERPLVVARRRPVVGELGPVRRLRGSRGRRVGLEGERALAVEPSPLAGEQLVVRHLGEQRVAERVALGSLRRRVHDEDLAGDRRPQRRLEPVGAVGGPGDRDQQVVVDPASRDGDDPEHVVDVLGHGRQAGQEDLPQRRRQAAGRRLGLRQQQLLDEERVAVGSAMDPGDELRVGGDALDRLEQRGGLVLRQAGQGEPLHAAGPLELAEPRERRVTAVQLVRAQRHRDEDRFRAQGSDEEAQGLAGRRVRPVDVLDQHEDGRDRGQPPQHADQGVEQAGLEPGLLERRPRRPGIQRRDEPGEVGAGRADHGLEAFGVQLADELAEDLDDRAVRQALITDVRARPAEDEHAASLGGAHPARPPAGSCPRRPRRRSGGGRASPRRRHRARRAPRRARPGVRS